MKDLLKIAKDRNSALLLSDMIPFCDILDDKKTIATKEGSVLQVIQLQGKDYTGLTVTDCESFFRERKLCFQQLPPEIKFSVHYHRKKFEIQNSHPDFGNKYANEINEIQNKKFSTSYRTEIFLVITLPDKRLTKNLGIASKKLSNEFSSFDKAIIDISNITENIISKLQAYKPHILYHTNDGNSALLKFWLYILNGGVESEFTPVNITHLNDTLALTNIDFRSKEPKELFENLNESAKKYSLKNESIEEIKSIVRKEFSTFGKDYVVYHHHPHRQYSSFLSISQYPDESEYNILEKLMATQARFNVIQHIAIKNQEKAKEQIKTKMERARTLLSFGASRYADLADHAQCLEAGEFEQASHIFLICVYGDSTDEVEKNINLLQQNLAKSYIPTIRETAHTEAVFWSQFPDYEEFNTPRQVLISTLNIADFINFGSKNQGNLTCAFGNEPVSFFKTPDGQNYAFTFQPDTSDTSAGHTLVIGGTGAGKTVFMSYLLMQCLKFRGKNGKQPLKAIVFDSLKGMKIPCLAFGGDYIDFADDEVKLNPMTLPDTPENRGFLENWISALVGSADDNEKIIINSAIRSNFESLAPQERSLDAIRDAFGIEISKDTHTGKASIATRIKKWLPNKEDNRKSVFPYGMFFNHKTDVLSFNKRIVSFEMTPILKNQELLAPLTAYIFHAFSNHISNHPAPHICIMDEFLKFLENPLMFPFIRTALLEWRKRNGVFIGAVQDIGLMMGQPHIEELLNHFQTFIIFQNPTANEEDYCGSKRVSGIGLTSEEYKWVKSNNGDRQIMVKRKSGESVILNVDLSNLGEDLTFFRSEYDLVTKAENLIKEYPNEWREKLKEYAS